MRTQIRRYSHNFNAVVDSNPLISRCVFKLFLEFLSLIISATFYNLIY